MLLGLRQAVFFHFLVSRPFISTVVWCLALLPKMPKVLGSNLAEGLSVWSLHASSCDPKTQVRLISDTKIAHELFLCVGLTDDLSREASCPTTAGMGPSSAQNWTIGWKLLQMTINDVAGKSIGVTTWSSYRCIDVRHARCFIHHSIVFLEHTSYQGVVHSFWTIAADNFHLLPICVSYLHLFLSPWSCSLPHCQCWWAFIPAKNWSWKLSITL